MMSQKLISAQRFILKLYKKTILSTAVFFTKIFQDLLMVIKVRKIILILAFFFPLMAVSTPYGNPLQKKIVKKGKMFIIKLPANPTTGYVWTVRKSPHQVIYLGKHYVQSPECKKGIVGCSGIEILRFNAIEAGKGELQLQYVRPWDLPYLKAGVKLWMSS
ncbi:protease inhibitor I42 family protein [Serratia symbiotica]|uniref:protease inhibitor I42 family protein n=1 Tax=Serratia symbiotica TaxID=138074 RepID=UPI003463EF95